MTSLGPGVPPRHPHRRCLGLLDFLPALGDAEAIVAGQAVAVPLRVRLAELRPRRSRAAPAPPSPRPGAASCRARPSSPTSCSAGAPRPVDAPAPRRPLEDRSVRHRRSAPRRTAGATAAPQGGRPCPLRPSRHAPGGHSRRTWTAWSPSSRLHGTDPAPRPARGRRPRRHVLHRERATDTARDTARRFVTGSLAVSAATSSLEAESARLGAPGLAPQRHHGGRHLRRGAGGRGRRARDPGRGRRHLHAYRPPLLAGLPGLRAIDATTRSIASWKPPLPVCFVTFGPTATGELSVSGSAAPQSGSTTRRLPRPARRDRRVRRRELRRHHAQLRDLRHG